MKRIFSLQVAMLLLVIACFPARTNAQTISYTNASPVICSVDTFQVWVSGCTPGDTILAYFGDGTSQSAPVSCTGSAGVAYFLPGHNYPSPGLYTLKLVLSAGGIAVDSMHMNQKFTCNSVQCFVYHDVNLDCMFNSGDTYIYGEPTTLEIDSAGTLLDTITTTCGFSYPALGPTGTIYAFKLIKAPYGYSISCAGDTIVYDTIGVTTNEPSIGFVCNPTDSFDLAVSAFFKAGVDGAGSAIFITNSSCIATPATVTLNYSPKYYFDSVSYTGVYSFTASGNSITFNLGGVSSNTFISIVGLEFSPVGTLTLGDTANATSRVNPFVGDVDTSNNIVIICDTIHMSWDPNYKSVTPAGNIEPGTLLKYMISFENTGNDTAFNIHVMDTLSDNLDISTFKVVSATAYMNLIFLKSGGHNIVKFDFPNINLLDTAQHYDYDGMVTYTIRAKTGLAAGTKIDNAAGIYFDANAVVMTNNVENIIGTPTSITSLGNVPVVNIYPNPTMDILNINGVKQNTSYSLFSITSEFIEQGTLSQGSNQLSMKNFATGVYILEMTGKDGVRSIVKVVKE